MRAGKLLVAGLVSIVFASAAIAEEPAPRPEAKPESQPAAKVDDAVAFQRQYTPEEALARGRELRKLVDKGDAQAAFDFAVLLTRYGRFGSLADPGTVEEWSSLANEHSAFDWVMLAAEAGNQPAIGAVCKMAQDYLAPAHMREKGQARCEQLRQKYPAK